MNPSHDHRTEDLLILNLNPSESISQSYTPGVVVHLALDLEHICGFSIRSITVGHFGSLPSSHLIPSELNPYWSFGIFVSGSFGRWVLYAVVGHFKAVGHFGSLPRNLPSRIFPTLSLYSLPCEEELCDNYLWMTIVGCMDGRRVIMGCFCHDQMGYQVNRN